ncbi:MAG: hypothetical protein ACYDD1_00155 [Caulobacteraceae bacterium]
MTGVKRALLAQIVMLALAHESLARPRIADKPPNFRIYDVDQREQQMRRLLAHLAGTPALSYQRADKLLGVLDNIQREEQRMRAQQGGRLTLPTVRVVDARLNALSRRLHLRGPSTGAAASP